MTHGSGLAVPYAFLLSLTVAAHLPGGLAVWTVFWSVAAYRGKVKSPAAFRWGKGRA